MIIGMGKESITMLMEVVEWNDDKEHGRGILSMLIEMFMMVNGKMIRSMEKDFFFKYVEKRLMVCRIMMNCCLHRYDNSICDYHEFSISYVDCV